MGIGIAYDSSSDKTQLELNWYDNNKVFHNAWSTGYFATSNHSKNYRVWTLGSNTSNSSPTYSTGNDVSHYKRRYFYIFLVF